MPTKSISDDIYQAKFRREESPSGTSINARALERALDIRKFEIDLYWKRASYFWTFIAATLAGFLAIQAVSVANKDDISVFLCCLGTVFSFGWVCVNRGSKYWQENWEYHVDMLEDSIHGPLYKVVLSRREPSGVRETIQHCLTGPSPISVSKVNQLISVFVTIVWVALLFYSLPPIRVHSPIDWRYVFIIGISALACVSFVTLARSYQGGYWHRATIRTAEIKNSE